MRLLNLSCAILLLQNAVSGYSCTGVQDSLAKPAELPRMLLDTKPLVQTGKILAVALNCSNFQKQINAAVAGDTISIPAGTQCTGNFILTKKPASNAWIVIRTSTPDSVLPPGSRLNPAMAVSMAQILTPNSEAALQTEPGAHHYRLIGLEIGLSPKFSAPMNYGLVLLGDGSSAQNTANAVPSDIVIDRCYIHGLPAANVSRALALNSVRSSVIDSYLSEIHADGYDTQAIAGWNGPGPYKIVNNYLEAAGENVMFGGALGYIPGIVPSDIEIRGNHFFKPLSWRMDDPSYAGRHWTIKNSFELKNAQRLLIDGNIFENNWIEAQVGYALVFTVRTETTMTWNVVQDVTFTNNIVRNSSSGVNILGKDNNGNYRGQTQRLVIQNNVFEGLAKDGGSFQILEGAKDITINHNTLAFSGGRVMLAFDGLPSERIVFTNNLAQHGQYGLFGSGKGVGKVALSQFAPTNVFSNNLLIGGKPFATIYPGCTYFVDSMDEVGFAKGATDPAYQLADTSKFRNAAFDSKSVGADVRAVANATRNTVSGK